MEKFNLEAAVRVSIEDKPNIETPLIIDIILAYEKHKKRIEHEEFTAQKMAIVPMIIGEV